MTVICIQMWICDMCKNTLMLSNESSVYTDEMMDFPKGWDSIEDPEFEYITITRCPGCQLAKYDT